MASRTTKMRLSPRRWSYAQVTAETEQLIQRCLKSAAEDKVGGSDYGSKLQIDYAYGAYSLWRSITAGWIKDKDKQRLNALFEGTPYHRVVTL